MRSLTLGLEANIPRGAVLKLSRGSAGGQLFPRLEVLCWYIDETVIPTSCFHLFLPPQLKSVDLSYSGSGISRDGVAPLVHIISSLTSSLEYLTFYHGQSREMILEDTLSSFVCQRGSSLRSFDSDVLLSEAAIHHLMQLPNLRFWVGYHEPPRTLPPITFPSLECLHLDQTSLPWLHLLASHGKEIVRKGSTPAASRTNIRETLDSLECSEVTTIDSAFVHSVINFRNLVSLRAAGDCTEPEVCISRFTDGDVEELAAALPRLEALLLGPPCYSNSCNTTVASLMSISVNCLELKIHFNTRDIIRDLRFLLQGNSGRDRPKCKVWNLMVGDVPLEVQGVDVETVAMGFRVILPHLKHLGGWENWLPVRAALSALE